MPIRPRQLMPYLFVALLPLTAAAIEPPPVGSNAPDFSLPDQNGQQRQLSDYKGQWLLLYFYPKDDTPGCTEEACQFRDHITVLNAMGTKVVGVSLDDVASHAAFASKHQLPFSLLADTEGVVTSSYGALRDLLVIKMAKRYSFLINPEGQIAKRYLSVDSEQHAREVIEDLQQLQSSTQSSR